MRPMMKISIPLPISGPFSSLGWPLSGADSTASAAISSHSGASIIRALPRQSRFFYETGVERWTVGDRLHAVDAIRLTGPAFASVEGRAKVFGRDLLLGGRAANRQKLLTMPGIAHVAQSRQVLFIR